MSKPIKMLARRFGYFPKAFELDGKRYTVQSVNRCWTKAGRTPRLYFSVECTEGIFTLCLSVNTGNWSIG